MLIQRLGHVSALTASAANPIWGLRGCNAACRQDVQLCYLQSLCLLHTQRSKEALVSLILWQFAVCKSLTFGCGQQSSERLNLPRSCPL